MIWLSVNIICTVINSQQAKGEYVYSFVVALCKYRFIEIVCGLYSSKCISICLFFYERDKAVKFILTYKNSLISVFSYFKILWTLSLFLFMDSTFKMIKQNCFSIFSIEKVLIK